MNKPFDQQFEAFKQHLDELVDSFQRPQEKRIGYGNLRHSYSSWDISGECCTNVAVVYETPGGSTTQLNVTFDHNIGEFSHLDESLQNRIATHDPKEAFDYLKRHIDTIAAKRVAQLKLTVDAWLSEGKNRSQVFAELNKMLQAEFLGGRVNSNELKAGIQHAVLQSGIIKVS